MEQIHITPKLSNYVLDLLPPGEKRQVEHHTQSCPACREALQAEHHIELALHDALHATPLPSSARLQQLMPAPPSSQPGVRRVLRALGEVFSPSHAVFVWLRPAVALAFVAVLLMASLTFGFNGDGLWQGHPTSTVLAATATTSPTSTLTSTAEAPGGHATPSPQLAATPIAHLAPVPAQSTQ